MLKNWWAYEWRLAKRAAKVTSLKALGAGAVIGLFAYGFQWNYLLREHEIKRSILIGLVSTVVGILCEFLFKLHAAPARTALEQEEK
jgi:hypothetical protein